MKLKFFSYIAEQSFQMSPSGERLFLHAGRFWSKPYIVPDEETEKRLFQKQLWMLRIFLTALILSQPFLLRSMPNIMYVPLWFVIYLLVILALFYLVNWLIFWKDLHTLKRSNSRIRFPNFYRDLAKRTSWLGFFLGFLAYIGFIWAGLWIVVERLNPFVGWFSTIFFSLCAVVWVYAFYLKLTMPRDNDSGNSGTEA